MHIRKLDRDRLFLLLILFIQILLVSLTVGSTFGSTGDWLTQHTSIPAYLREVFYNTGRIAPDLTLGLGGGQNIFSLSYYGLFNPIFLFSYLLPFVPMVLYVQIVSILLYLLTGYLAYRWLRRHFDASFSLCGALLVAFIPALLYHAHHHIMFVWYMPFLLLAFIGVDKYFEERKFLLLSLCVCALILTSYMYSPCALLGLFLYYFYRLLGEEKFSFPRLFIGLLPFLLGIALSAVLLFPTVSVILGGRASDVTESSFSASQLLLPPVKNLLYHAYTPGLTCAVLLGVFSVLCSRKKQEWLFGLALLLFTVSPVVLLLLNGGMYIRGKALLPFIPLYAFCFCLMIQKLKDGKKLFVPIGALLIFILYAVLVQDFCTSRFILDAALTLVSVVLCHFPFKRMRWQIVALPSLAFLCCINLLIQPTEKYVSQDTLSKIADNNQAVSAFADQMQTSDPGYYRSLSLFNRLNTVNAAYGDRWYGTTMYSSTANSYYLNFYNYVAGNNIQQRNDYLSVSSNNTLFTSLMGVKYIYSPKEIDSLYYVKRGEKDGCYLYENTLALPMIYTAQTVMSESDFLALSYPDTLRALFGSIVVNGDIQNNQNLSGRLSEITVSALKESYSFRVYGEEETYTIPLDAPIEDKYLLIRLKLDYNPNYDINIAINGINNRLTARSWQYHNHNNVFEFTVSSDSPLSELQVTFTKGYYAFSDIEVYTLDLDADDIPFSAATITDYNEKKSTITSTVSVENDGYLATTFPYDEGFKIFVDGKETKLLRVNTAFVGCAVSAGEHEVTIVYRAPGYALGRWISTIAVFLLIIFFIIQYIRKKKRKDTHSVILQ